MFEFILLYPLVITYKSIRKNQRIKNYNLIVSECHRTYFCTTKIRRIFLICKIFKDFFLKIFSLKLRTLIPFGHCKDKDIFLIYKKIREKFLLKMNFIILRIIFRKYLLISKILLSTRTLFIIKNFYQISTH